MMNIVTEKVIKNAVEGIIILMQISRADKWRIDYGSNRYMQYLSLDKLEQRFACILNNMLKLNKDGKVSMREPGNDFLWIKLYTEISEEFNARHIELPTGESLTDYLQIPRIPRGIVKKISRDDLENKPSDRSVLFKYGQYRFLKKMMMEGEVRVSPAAFYSDKSLNIAIKDDELGLACEYHPKGFEMSYTDPNTKYTFTSAPIGNVKVESRSSTNYYVYCLSCIYDVNLYTQFEADACLVIKNTALFQEKLFKAFEEKMSNEWSGFYRKVKYIDPLQDFDKNRDVFTEKTFDYWYQQEVRFAWVPKQIQDNNLEHVFVDIGSMEDYCELIQLK